MRKKQRDNYYKNYSVMKGDEMKPVMTKEQKGAIAINTDWCPTCGKDIDHVIHELRNLNVKIHQKEIKKGRTKFMPFGMYQCSCGTQIHIRLIGDLLLDNGFMSLIIVGDDLVEKMDEALKKVADERIPVKTIQSIIKAKGFTEGFTEAEIYGSAEPVLGNNN